MEGETGEGLPRPAVEVHQFLSRWGSRRWDGGGVNPAVAEGASMNWRESTEKISRSTGRINETTYTNLVTKERPDVCAPLRSVLQTWVQARVCKVEARPVSFAIRNRSI